METIRDFPLIRKKRPDAPYASLRTHDGPVPFFTFPILDEAGVKNGFSTRFGGVSRGFCAELNLAALREPQDIVQENFRRICGALHMNAEKAVLSWQSHLTNILTVTEADAGKGAFFERDYRDIDGLVTNVPGIPLVTLFADCVPLYFYDPVQKAIGLSHAGWRGTRAKMGEITVRALGERFGSRPEDLICAIGPSICGDCYEVSDDVAEEFRKAFPGLADEILLKPVRPGHFLLDLWEANLRVLLGAGVRPERIEVTDICTKCNSDILWSHRVTGEKRGLMGALLSL